MLLYIYQIKQLIKTGGKKKMSKTILSELTLRRLADKYKITANFNDMQDLEDELIAWGCFNRELREELIQLGIDREEMEL